MKKIEAMVIDFIRANDYKMAQSLCAVYGISTKRYEELKVMAK